MSEPQSRSENEAQLEQPLLDSARPNAAQASYQQELEAAGDETQRNAASPASPLSKLMFLTLAGLLVIGLGTFLTTYVIMANRPPGPTPPPQCRKSAVLVVTQSSSLGHVHEDGTPQQPQRQALVWSGKGHKATLVYNDLHAMDLDSNGDEWHQVYDHTGEKDIEGPVSRWKSVAAYDERLPGIVMMGGDSVVHPKRVNRYLNDLWLLGTNDSFPSWQLQLDKAPEGAVAPSAAGEAAQQEPWEAEIFDEEAGDEDALLKRRHQHLSTGEPAPRRAHAGDVLQYQDSSHLVITGGRTHAGAVLGDVWGMQITDLQGLPASPGWQLLWDPLENEGPAPASRKGHAAVTLPGPEPALFIWGGRNSTDYFEDGWVFHVGTRSWTELAADPTVHQPRARDHLGAFYYQGSVWIYGGRGGPSYAESHALADLWAFDLATHKWSKQHIKGPAPPARFLYSMAFYTDPGNSSAPAGSPEAEGDGKMLIFGGEGQDRCYLSDMWRFSLIHRAWELLSENVPCQNRCVPHKSRNLLR